ncbi:hypothetical protein ACSNN7_00805 [Micromonospora sp. URMC 105]|uniref:hypothetical protein n=1 Tax=Micromonospora sp. URMC 105 TaxID=3423413 RepID=UPI003F1E0984
MNAITGTWDLTVKTPIGSLAAVYTFTDHAGELTGTAEGGGESVALADLRQEHTADGQQVTWRQAVTRPMRLNLEFDVTVTGDTLTGHSRAGRLPRSRVTGTRRPT